MKLHIQYEMLSIFLYDKNSKLTGYETYNLFYTLFIKALGNDEISSRKTSVEKCLPT